MNIKKNNSNKNKGITLMELLLAIPIFAIVAIASTYVFSSMIQVSTLNTGYLECQIAANNLLTYMEGTKRVAKPDGSIFNPINGCTKIGGNQVLDATYSPTADASFKVDIKRQIENGLEITSLTVTKIGTDNSFIIKTHFPNTYYK